MRLLVTGGCGFIGSNLAKAGSLRGHEVVVFDNLSRHGSEQNRAWLEAEGGIRFQNGDVRSRQDIERLIRDFRPEAIFHMAGQVAMTTSVRDPWSDFEINVIGGVNVLESVRQFAPETIVFYSSTNKVYGGIECAPLEEGPTRYFAPDFPEGFGENIPLDFQTPYGCSKGAVDQYMLDYHRMFGVRAVVFRHSSVFGGRQFSTFDQGWIGWFVGEALRARHGKATGPIAIAGNGKQVRDVLFCDDLARCYFAALENIGKAAGNAYNIGGGMKNSLSLVELFSALEKRLDVRLEVARGPWRASDQKVFVADTRKAREGFGWEPLIGAADGLDRMIEWVSTSGEAQPRR